jgi:hypothetical protein
VIAGGVAGSLTVLTLQDHQAGDVSCYAGSVRYALLLGVLAACGDNLAASGSFELVGHADLGARGMSSALAVVGDTVYVGSRRDHQGIAIVDVSSPTAPVVVGEIGDPEGVAGMSSRELRAVADLDLLIVLNLSCSPALHGCDAVPAEGENLRFYDIHDRRAPRLVSTYPVHGTTRQPRSPHEFFLWRQDGRVLVYLTTPPGPPSFEVIDASDPAHPTSVVTWDPVVDGGLPSGGVDDILHSVGASDDGRTGYFSHQQGGLALVDLGEVIDGATPPALAMITPPTAVLDWSPPSPMGPHSAVKVPGRELLIVTEEIYPMPYGAGCPWGHLRTVDISAPAAPVIAGELGVPENEPSTCATQPGGAFTAHNATVTHDLALVTWYAAGLEAIDISDPDHPLRLAELRTDPLPSVTNEDPGLGGALVEMWSYPVIQDGLIYVIDVRNGLYILRYHGLHSEQVESEKFLEGNSRL